MLLLWLILLDPSLFMGLGNFISMPIALAVGRRPVFLVSCVVQVIALILCATNNGYAWHFAARCVLGLAAGQSEALCPLIISVSPSQIDISLVSNQTNRYL
jgi:MFS family permease